MKKAVQTKEMDERTEIIFSQLTPSEIVMNLSDVSLIEKNDVSFCFSLCFNGIPNRKNGKINGILPMIILMGQWDRTLAGYEWETSMEFNLPLGFGEFLVTVCQGTWPCKSSVYLICS